MSTVIKLPEKRQYLGQAHIPEEPPEKRPKLGDPQPRELDDTAMELQIRSKSEEAKSAGEVKSAGGFSTHTRRDINPYCEICYGHVGHQSWDCPDKSKGMGMGCRLCYGPCKKNEHEDDDDGEHRSIEMVKYCIVCGSMGRHWGDDCPYWSEAKVDNSEISDDDYVAF
ncbi:uncharacterized protein LOC121049385 [Rosa chinensis]|uniref:uncharacterized protein LOC121049385 n=1 Tax=Rosa chinensis TaxID=74649 RepID=UPI001AD8AB37|nr:uncharacterized protein LOC121049385 [Rosa chinensis]